MAYDLEQIEEVCSKATPGPWHLDTDYIYAQEEEVCILCDGVLWRHNGNFIALTRTVLPELCARVRELEDFIERSKLGILFDELRYLKEAYQQCSTCQFKVNEHYQKLEGENAALRKVAEKYEKELLRLLHYGSIGWAHDQIRDVLLCNPVLSAVQRPTNCEPGEGKGE